ncbi:MAG TPA: glycosyltransferase family 4 protein [Dongiaceae bacterium]|nr:glycosyltransferase family 4 protein [Dongiaceae bacterium]
MKICAIGLRGIPGIMGGIEKHCEQIYPRIAALDDGIKLQVTGRSPYLKDPLSSYQGVEVVSLWAVRNKYLETILHTFLAVLYARFIARADLVHIHAIGPGLLSPLARLLGMKVLITHHGADYQRQKWNRIARFLLRTGERLAISSAHRTIVVGSSLCEQLKRQYPTHAGKLIYIPNGANIEQRDPAVLQNHPVLQQFGLQPRQYVLAVGRLVPEKGFQDLVQAFVDSQLPGTLVITGQADHPDDFSRNLLRQQSERIIFTGFQSGDALAALYANAALFVLPSYHEGLPIAALEALSFGRPVLLSDIEPNRDLKLPASCYFTTGDQRALAQKIQVADYNCYQVDTRDILSRFDWDDIARQALQQMQWASGSAVRPG